MQVRYETSGEWRTFAATSRHHWARRIATALIARGRDARAISRSALERESPLGVYNAQEDLMGTYVRQGDEAYEIRAEVADLCEA